MTKSAAPENRSYSYEGSNGHTVILIHGMTGAPAEMKFIARRLRAKGFGVVVPLLAGHCQGEAAFLKSTWRDWFESLEHSLENTARRADRISVAGICVGGALGLHLAARHPNRIHSAAIYSAALNYDGWNTPFYFKYAGIIVPLGIHIPFIRDIKIRDSYPYGIKSERIRNAVMHGSDITGGGIEGTLPSFPARGLYENYKINKALINILPAIRTPTLLIHSREDDVCHPRNSEYIKKNLGGLSELVLLNNSYHMIHVDQEHSQVAEMTADFFMRH